MVCTAMCTIVTSTHITPVPKEERNKIIKSFNCSYDDDDEPPLSWLIVPGTPENIQKLKTHKAQISEKSLRALGFFLLLSFFLLVSVEKNNFFLVVKDN